ncbi:hypothetical protein Acor_81870 [Acrocarpospora corrugata]|uniref:Uncharacterized protein n=1 Tax=Acrocarpospora corrugata TaxID=35763 RepID=A0A5M3WID5_9ACTN|nr:hypothetical protein Acor_81870 [Acrocarpospora corrugata]
MFPRFLYRADPQVGAGMRTTGRLRRACGRAVVDGGRTVMQAARDHRPSWPVAMREMRAYAAQVVPETIGATDP